MPRRNMESETTPLKRYTMIKMIGADRNNEFGEVVGFLPPEDREQCLYENGVPGGCDSLKSPHLLSRGKLIGVHHKPLAVCFFIRHGKIERCKRIVGPVQQPSWHSIMLLQEIDFGFGFPSSEQSCGPDAKILGQVAFLS